MKQFIATLIAAIGLCLNLAFAGDTKPQNVTISATSAPTTTSEMPKDKMQLLDQKVALGTQEFALAKHSFDDTNKLAIHMKMMGWRQATPIEHADVVHKLGKKMPTEKNVIILTKLSSQPAASTGGPATAQKPGQ